MGCGLNSGKKAKLDDKKQGFVVTIINPYTKEQQCYKYYDEKQKSDLIMNVMNGLCFSEKVNEKVDGNFISIYDALEDRFHYFVQRLMGIEIENANEPLKGRMWVPYINDKRQDWDTLVENNTRISINDQLVWKLEFHKKDKDARNK